MRRDSIFYKLFKQRPELLFELIEQSVPDADRDRFDSVEVKETAFRIDGVFLPPDDAESKVVFFSEVQLQKKENLYKRFFAELFVSLHRAEIDYDDWGGVLIFGSRSVEPSSSVWYRSLLESPQVFRIYLDEIEQWQNPPLAIEIVLLAMSPETETPDRARALLDRSGRTIGNKSKFHRDCPCSLECNCDRTAARSFRIAVAPL
jgi:predicted transposase/invertase (TIGR01784 family)